MSRVTVILNSVANRQRVAKWAMSAPLHTRVEFKETKRSVPQNDRMHAMLTDIATQVLWHGLRLSKDDWKLIFLDGLKREMRIVPNLDGTGFVSLSGRSSSDLTVDEMTGMITLMHMFGANPAHPVNFGDEPKAAAA